MGSEGEIPKVSFGDNLTVKLSRSGGADDRALLCKTDVFHNLLMVLTIPLMCIPALINIQM